MGATVFKPHLAADTRLAAESSLHCYFFTSLTNARNFLDPLVLVYTDNGKS